MYPFTVSQASSRYRLPGRPEAGAVATSPSGNASPYTETDYTWDIGFTHQFTPHLAFAQDNYFRIDRHYLDEGQFGFVPIDAPFNYVRGYGGGTENSLT